MKFSEQWLREWVNPGLSTAELCEQLSMAGLEVDDIIPAAPEFKNVVVARVEAVEPHPDADKLRVCRVNDGGTEPLQIVCGAPNVEVGMRVALAQVGALLPNGMKIKPAKLRGVASAGMLCSPVEVGLAEHSEGLLALPEEAPIGADLRDYLSLDDHVIDIDLTPNRGDCLSVLGVAREVAALNSMPLAQPDYAELSATHDEQLEVRIDVPDACSRYVGRVIKSVNPDAQTPQWMVERLRRSGIRAIHPVVDITNYVLIELGQPMHGFDLARLNGSITVRMAERGEKLAALSEETLNLTEADLVIADEGGPVALAGVMGGASSAVGPTTSDIFLESACFMPKAMAGTARRHRLHTDSSHRFERGVDPQQQSRAIHRATQLILEICGGEPGELVIAGTGASDVNAVALRHERASRLLGFDLSREKIEETLTALNMQYESKAEGEWLVTPPSYRYDIRIEADLIEELVRIIGYDNLPTRPQQVVLPAMQMTERQVGVNRLRETLIQRDYHEAVTYSFVEAEKQAQLVPDLPGIDLDNPISSQLGQMRTSLWASMLPALLHNQQRQQDRVRLFEIGLRFLRGDSEGGIRQETMLSGVVSGPVLAEQWGVKSQDVDFYDVKADVEALLSLGGQGEGVRFVSDEHAALHPGQSARIVRGDEQLGWIGVLHPRLLPVFDLKVCPVLFELNLNSLVAAQVPAFVAPSDFPAMRRDLAWVVQESVSVQELIDNLTGSGESLLKDIQVFDVYRGEGLPSGCKSVALGLNFQDKSRTLTEDEVEGAVRRLADKIGQALNATIRG